MGKNLIFVGISLGVFASMTGTIGKQLLRFSELQKRKGGAYNLYIAKVALIVGLALNTAMGPIVDMLSYMFAPQSLIAPLGGLDVVWNTLIAPCTLNEKLTVKVVFGVALIAAGATSTSLFGNHDDKDYTLDIVKDIFLRPTVAIYLGSLLVWLLFNIFALQSRGNLATGEPDPIRGLSLGLTAGSIAGNMFCVKAFIELVQASIRDSDGEIWAHWLPYCLLLGAILFAVSNLYFLTKAMREYEALFMGAVFEGSLIVCACVSGIVVFSDLEDLETYQVIIYFTALLGMVVGILLVALGCSKPEEDSKPEDSKPEVSEEELAQPTPVAKPAPIEQEVPPDNANRARVESNFSLASMNSLSKHLKKRERVNTVDSSPFPGQSAILLDKMVSRRRIDTMESVTEDDSRPPPPEHVTGETLGEKIGKE